MSIYLVDSHCHLHLLEQGTDEKVVELVIDRAKAQGIQYFLNVCVSMKDIQQLLSYTNRYPFVSASCGLHPNYEGETVTKEILIEYGIHPKVIAIGETGLDYYRSSGDLEWQRERFKVHIEAAHEVKKPLIIHTRQAKEDTIAIMREMQADKIGGVMHCFTEDWVMAKDALDLGFYISFSGIVTFKNAQTIQEVAKKMPLDKILIETDCPYLAPIPYRGKPNEPAYLYETAKFIADLRNMSLEDFANTSTDNFFNLFTGAQRTHV